MNPTVIEFKEKKFLGKKILMQMADNKTFELWRSFMPLRKEIKNLVSNDLFSIQIFDPKIDFKDFTQDTYFEKWAAAEVLDFDGDIADFDILNIESGLYAVYPFIGTPDKFQATFLDFYQNWLLKSDYELDNRPHFQVMGEKYKNNDPTSEEEIWVPIKLKTH